MDLQEVVSKVVEDHLFVLVERIQSQWSSVDEGIFTDHHITLRRFTPSTNMVRLGLDFKGMGAFILEYGSGSLMVTNTSSEIGDYGNPDLPDYLSSSWFNKARYFQDYAFIGRKAGDTIHAPDGSTKTSTGKRKGQNLEVKKPKSKLEPFNPKEAMHIIETEVMHWSKELEESIEEAVGEWIEFQFDDVFTRSR